MGVSVHAVVCSCPSVFSPHHINTTVFCFLCVCLIWPSSFLIHRGR
uniref:Uncharacterized protein n=1 Tax=Seriola dumerili TaxID=41447 RepID=A0A3B4TGL0_SERDU